jgi:hypothetical protein
MYVNASVHNRQSVDVYKPAKLLTDVAIFLLHQQQQRSTP